MIEERTEQETWKSNGNQTTITNTKYGWTFTVDGYPFDVAKGLPYHARFINCDYFHKPISKDRRVRNRLYRTILRNRNSVKGLLIGNKLWKPLTNRNE